VGEARAILAAGMQVTANVRLVSPLGKGGMGAVWLADHAGLNTRVVVKFMLDGLGSSATARLRFSREAAAAAQVKSPHVVSMYDHGVTEEGVPFIVMEHLEGRDLAAVIADRGALDPGDVVSVVSQIAKALTKVHAAGLLHRDIKPDNIFMCDGEDELFVKLLDFGVAKSRTAEPKEGTLDSETKTGQVVGTPYYMSPEQVTAQKTLDARSDLWSLGVVAFEALTGQRPFDGPSFGALAVKIATGEPPAPSSVNPKLPRALDEWFARACAREPADRFATAKELADGLRAVFEGVVSMPRSALPSESGSRGPSSLPPPGPGGGDVSPSLAHAQTMNQNEPSTEASVLGRSEPGSVVVASQAEPARRGPKIALFAAAGAAVLAVVVSVVGRGPSAPVPVVPVAPLANRDEAAPSTPAAPDVDSKEEPDAATAASGPDAASAAAPESAPAPVPESSPATARVPGPRVRPRVAPPAPAPAPDMPRPEPTPAHDDPLF
jgi:eukaryotic-like serine/threonine-protein kinase